MRITDLQVDGFGVWSGLRVGGITSGMTVFYGPNEAGKTTLLQFVRAILYGFAEDRRDRYLPPVFGGQGGGSIVLNGRTGEYHVQRLVSPGRAIDEEGQLNLIGDDGAVAGSEALQQLLGNVNESVFSNVFAIGLREIQELATLNDTDAAHELYKLASGLDRVSLIDVMRDLRGERNHLAGSEGKGLPVRNQWGRALPTLAAEVRDLERQIEQARGGSKRWVQLGAEITEIDGELSRLGETIDREELTGRRLELAMQIAPRWRERDGLSRRMEALGKLPPAEKVSLDRLERVNAKISSLVVREEEASRRLSALREEARQLPIEPRLLENSCRIQALAEHRPWMESLDRQIVRLREEMRELHREMGLSTDGTEDDDFVALDEKTLEVNSRTISKLKPAVRSLRKHRQRYESALHAKQDTERQYVETQETYEGLLRECQCEDLDEALEAAGKQVNQIKRRRAIDERLERLEQQRRQLEAEVDEANEAQVMPVGRTLLVGLFVVFGCGLAFFGFAGLLMPKVVSAFPMMGVVGLAIAMGGWVVKLVGDSRARNQLDRTQRQVDLLASQLRRAKQEREQIPLPYGNEEESDSVGPEEALQRAQDELAQLEELLPVRSELDECERVYEEADEQVELAKEQLDSAQRRWEMALESVQLPTSLTPARVKSLSQQSEKISEAKHRLVACRKELRDREQELARLNERVFTLVNETECHDDENEVDDRHGYQAGDEAAVAINSLTARLGEQRRYQEQRAELKRTHKDQRKNLRGLQRQRRKLESFRDRLFAAANARNESHYREIVSRIAQLEKLIEELGHLDQQIDAAIGKNFPREEILDIVAQRGEKGLEPAWEEQLAKIEKLEQQRNEMNMLRGERLHEMKSLGEDRTVDRLEMKVETLRKQMRMATQRWRTLTLTYRILDSVRRRYEQERQPETLTEASLYLKAITRGKYTRIWTRLEGDMLFVDQREGQTLRVDVLSQGTREAIFLSLRLALASAYARRGIEFPLVLDDLLVNYDAERTRAAAQLLVEYAKRGRQVILFTCHDHIRDLFHELSADVLILPGQREVLERDATAEPYHVSRWEAPDEEEEELLEEEPEAVEEEYEEEYEEEAANEEEYDEEYEEAADEPVEAVEEEGDEELEEVDDYEEESVDEFDEEEQEVLAHEPEEEPEPVVSSDPPMEELDAEAAALRERFTWNSPDMWWEDDGEDAA